ncbi:MAG: UDP-3-O-(3-hydroxymyristoyl)glucosamine N-acyltransferase, partial [Burkholderiales bacterium]
MNYLLSEIVTKLGGQVVGEDILISGIAPTNLASPGWITFIADKKYKKDLASCRASAIILSEADATELAATSLAMSKIICDNPYLYFSQVSRLFHPKKQLPLGIKATAILGDKTIMGNDCTVLDYVVIGSNSKIGNRCQIYPHVVIGDNVTIGDDVVIHANVTIYDNVTIGNQCEFHSGVIIGADGFGYAPDKHKHWHKIPQVGGVIIGDKVEVGANTTIDCGALGPTIIEDGVIIDNLVQIAHNVKIGAHTAIAATAAIAGSSTIGKFCTLAGGCAISGHVEICDHSVIGGMTGISKSITKPDLYMGAYPFSTYKDYAKNAVQLRKLSEMAQKLKSLEQQVKQLMGE